MAGQGIAETLMVAGSKDAERAGSVARPLLWRQLWNADYFLLPRVQTGLTLILPALILFAIPSA